jgi:chemotaxis protein MotB
VIAIVAAQDERILLGANDAAVVNAPILPGTRFTVVRADRRIFHPVTREYLGWLLRVLGSAEVTCRGERTSTVALRATNDAVSVGDYLIPIDPNDVLEQNVLAGNMQPECIPAGARDGVIVAFNDDRNAVGEQDLAYIDIGTAAGVTPGRRFTIYQQIAPEGRIPVGELQVLRAGVQTSTALITSSFLEVQVGYLLRAR